MNGSSTWPPILASASHHSSLLEESGYFRFSGEQIYYVVHSPKTPVIGAFLICPPFGIERERSYGTMVRWARVLALMGFVVLRFDYRGTGESTGKFEKMTFSTWKEDVAFCAGELLAMVGGVPLVLHGIRFGCLLAASQFKDGTGAGMLSWAPPTTGSDMLLKIMRRELASKLIHTPKGLSTSTRAELLMRINSGGLVNIEGYLWSKALWDDAQTFDYQSFLMNDGRPWYQFELSRTADSKQRVGDHSTSHIEFVQAAPFWEDLGELLPQCENLFAASVAWLRTSGIFDGSRTS